MAKVDQNAPKIRGAKKGGGGGGGNEAANTLRSAAVFKVLGVISHGQIAGICGGAEGIYVNDTPLRNQSGEYNYPKAAWAYRVGLPEQPYIPGFDGVTSETSVGVPLTNASPVVRTLGSAVDAINVKINFPQGLSYMSETADRTGTTVELAFDTKLTSSSTWETAAVVAVSGKQNSAYQKAIRVPRALGVGNWDVRFRRLTGDPTTQNYLNATQVASFTEIQEVKVTYPMTAYLAFIADSQSFSQGTPTISVLTKGLLVRVPTNYNPETREYTGLWNGTFKYAWTDNPAWCLYDLLTNAEYGLGKNSIVTESIVNKFSFYSAAVYCDELVPDGQDGEEPRFTFNAVLNQRDDALKVLDLIASSMRAKLIYWNGLIDVVQDRPADPKSIITKANIINGKFVEKSSKLSERHTVFNVTYNDRTNRYQQQTEVVYGSEADLDFYGEVSADVFAIGATTPGQAIRHGKWAIETELNQTKVLTWEMSLEGFALRPNDVVSVYWDNYAGVSASGRVKAIDGVTLTLDRAVDLSMGSTIKVMLADGETWETRSIVEESGQLDTITLSAPFSTALVSQAIFGVTGPVEPRQYRIIDFKQTGENTVSIEALYHDPSKYSRIELGVSVPAPVYSNAQPVTCTPPTSLTFNEVNVNEDNTIKRSLLVSWSAPLQGVPSSYALSYRLADGEWVSAGSISGMSFTIDPARVGKYDVKVVAISHLGYASLPAEGSYNVDTAGGGLSPLGAPTDLKDIGTGTSTFAGVDLNVQWTNPATNTFVLGATLRDFEVRTVDTVSGTVMRTEYVQAVGAGGTQTYSYTFGKNVADGGPRRTVRVEVRCRDANNNLSDPAIVVFSNPSPGVPSNLTVLAGIGSNKITCDRPSDLDFSGLLIWRDTVPAFALTEDKVIYDGPDLYISDTALDVGTTYFYRVAAYDTFGKSLTGTGMNVSAQLEGTPLGITSEDIQGQIESAQIAAIEASKILGLIGMDQLEGDLPNVGADISTLDEEISRLSDAVMQLADKADQTDGVFRDVGVSVDPLTGEVTVRTIEAVKASVDQANALIVQEQVARASADEALTSEITLLSSTVDDNTAAIVTEASTRATETGNLMAKWAVKTDVNGYVSGFGLASTANNAVPTSAFVVSADSFAIGSPTGPGIMPKIPFVVYTTPTVVDGITVAPGVYMDSAVIASLQADKIATNTINGNKIIANTITADRLVAGTITAASAVLASASILAANITDANVTRAKIADLAVNTAKIDDLAVTAAKIEDLAVTNAKLANAAITEAKIDNAAITAAKIADAAITSAKIEDAAINTLKIAGEAVTVPRYVEVYGTGGSTTFTLDEPAKVVIIGSANVNANSDIVVSVNGTSVIQARHGLTYSIEIPYATTSGDAGHTHGLSVNQSLNVSNSSVFISGSTGFADSHSHSFSGSAGHSHNLTGSIGGSAVMSGSHSHSISFPSIMASVTGSTSIALTGFITLAAGTHTVTCSGGHGSTTFKLSILGVKR
jgi:hypothetical protein